MDLITINTRKGTINGHTFVPTRHCAKCKTNIGYEVSKTHVAVIYNPNCRCKDKPIKSTSLAVSELLHEALQNLPKFFLNPNDFPVGG